MLCTVAVHVRGSGFQLKSSCEVKKILPLGKVKVSGMVVPGTSSFVLALPTPVIGPLA